MPVSGDAFERPGEVVVCVEHLRPAASERRATSSGGSAEPVRMNWPGRPRASHRQAMSVRFRVSDAETRAAEPHFAERAARDSLDAEGLREFAARVADGEPVTLRTS